MTNDFSFSPAGDQAALLTFGAAGDMALDAHANARVMALYEVLQSDAQTWLRDLVPSLRALLIFYDPQQIGFEALQDRVSRCLGGLDAVGQSDIGRQLRLPVCYDADFALDLENVAAATGLSTDQVLAKHQASVFKVYMLGFMPGAPYLGGLDEALTLPRRASPRAQVPAGSVAIAGAMSVIYPKQSPGGWHVLGRCPLPLFDAKQDAAPCLLAPGDTIHFQAISRADYDALLADPRGFDPLQGGAV